MSAGIKIAVIVPVYNCEKYLSDCLDSLLAQTYRDWNAYCVDDGAIDSSGKILDEYAKKDSRIIALHKPNGGEHSARNYALDRIKAGSDVWIAFVDGDDYISPFMFEHLNRLVSKINNPECQYMRLFCERTSSNLTNNDLYNKQLIRSKGSYVIKESELEFRLFDNDGYFSDGKCGGQISSAFIHSELIDKYHFRGPEEMRVLGDQVFTMKCAMKSKFIAVYKEKDYYYRFNPTSLLHTTKDTSEYIIRCLNYVYEAMKEDDYTPVRQSYMNKIYIPLKIENLLSVRFKSRSKAPLHVRINSDIKIVYYLRNIKYWGAYMYLKLFHRI